MNTIYGTQALRQEGSYYGGCASAWVTVKDNKYGEH